MRLSKYPNAIALKNGDRQDFTQPNDIEVDRDDNSSNSLYRVWKGMSLIGTFHHSPVDGKWIAYPTYGRDYQRHSTPDEAQQAIVEAEESANTIRSLDKGLEAV